MAFCQNCGAPLNDGAPFCTNCGAPANGQGPQGQYQQPYGQQYNPYQQPFGNPYNRAVMGQISPSQPISFGQRNIAICIILSIVTCGIYSIIWMISLINEVNEASENRDAPSGGLVFLLSIVTCGIYMFIWYYRAGEAIATAKNRRGMYAETSNGTTYLLLAIFGLSIVSTALIQTELNKIAAYHGAPPA